MAHTLCARIVQRRVELWDSSNHASENGILIPLDFSILIGCLASVQRSAISSLMHELDKIIRGRRSVRGFLPNRAVSSEVTREILELAQFSPSNCNVQPWRVYVVESERCDGLRSRLLAEFDEGNLGEPEDPIDIFFDEYRRLQIECAAELYGAMGVERNDKLGRLGGLRRNFEFFDAPHVMVICMDKSFGSGVAMDVGMYVQTLMLAMESRGIASCAQASFRQYPRILRTMLEIPDNLRIMCGLSFGYENLEVAANKARQSRRFIDSNVTFVR